MMEIQKKRNLLSRFRSLPPGNGFPFPHQASNLSTDIDYCSTEVRDARKGALIPDLLQRSSEAVRPSPKKIPLLFAILRTPTRTLNLSAISKHTPAPTPSPRRTTGREDKAGIRVQESWRGKENVYLLHRSVNFHRFGWLFWQHTTTTKRKLNRKISFAPFRFLVSVCLLREIRYDEKRLSLIPNKGFHTRI